MKVTVTWPDGHITEASDYNALYEAIKAQQHYIINDIHFRLVMRRRARRWSGSELPLFSSKQRFVKRMAEARMFELKEVRE